MDNLWQQHRTFILKILAGLGVVLVCWIVGASMNEKSLADRELANKSARRRISAKEVPSSKAINEHRSATEQLEKRVRFLASKVGETRKGDDLRRELISEVLEQIGQKTPANVSRFLKDARSTNPVTCIVGLKGRAREFLTNEASLANVVIDEDLGFGRLEDMEASQLDRYLITMKTIIDLVRLAIREEVYEVKSISIQPPPGGKFAGEGVFIREFPVRIEIRGPSRAVLNFIEGLNDPAHFIPLTELGRISKERSARDTDELSAEMEISALKIDPAAEFVEGQ